MSENLNINSLIKLVDLCNAGDSYWKGSSSLAIKAREELKKLLEELHPPSTALIRIKGRRYEVLFHGVYSRLYKSFIPVDSKSQKNDFPILIDVVK